MLKFIKHHMSTLIGVEIYPIFSFIVFFSIFLLAIWIALRAKKQHIERMSELPLED